MKRKLALALVVLVAALAALGWVKAQRGFSARDEPSTIEAMGARTMRAISMPSSAKELTSPKPIDDAAVTAALMHWADHCAICHGPDGAANTPIGRGLYPKPPDMRSELTQSKTDGELFYIIENGIRLTGMPAWGVEGRGEESWALVAFVRRLPHLNKAQLDLIEAMKPKSPHEVKEEQEEDEFLRGGSPNPEPKP